MEKKRPFSRRIQWGYKANEKRKIARIKKMYFETNKPRLNQDTLYDFVVHGLRGREVTSMRGPANTEEKQLINITKAERHALKPLPLFISLTSLITKYNSISYIVQRYFTNFYKFYIQLLWNYLSYSNLSATWARVSKLRTPWVANNRWRLELSGWNVVSGCYWKKPRSPRSQFYLGQRFIFWMKKNWNKTYKEK